MGDSGMSSACIARLNKEIRQLVSFAKGNHPYLTVPTGCDRAKIVQGPAGTPYEGGTFKLEILKRFYGRWFEDSSRHDISWWFQVPDRYPFEPPKIRFLTPIYHPNIDNGGRICLDTLNMPPKGQWKPAVNLSTLLATIQQLLGDPNPDDGLVPEITREYKHDRMKFEAEARARTMRDAVDSTNSTLQKSEAPRAPPGTTSERAGGDAIQEVDDSEDEEEEEEEEEEDLASLWGRGSQSSQAERVPGAEAESASRSTAGRGGGEDIVEESDEDGSGDDIFSQSFLGTQVSSAGAKRSNPGTNRQEQARHRQRAR